MKDAVESPVMNLAILALKLYNMPISNAMVGRVFSRLTLVKFKLRNRMCLKLILLELR